MLKSVKERSSSDFHCLATQGLADVSESVSISDCIECSMAMVDSVCTCVEVMRERMCRGRERKRREENLSAGKSGRFAPASRFWGEVGVEAISQRCRGFPLVLLITQTTGMSLMLSVNMTGWKSTANNSCPHEDGM